MNIVPLTLAALLALPMAGCSLFTGPGPDLATERAFAGRWHGGDPKLTLRFSLSAPQCYDPDWSDRWCDYRLEGTYEYVPPSGAPVTGRVSGTLSPFGVIDFDGPFIGYTTIRGGKLAADKQSFSTTWYFDEYRGAPGTGEQCPTCRIDNFYPSAQVTFVREP
jgi:hypothetical protein